MKKTLKSLLTLLLAVVMVFGVMSTTILAATASEDSAADGEASKGESTVSGGMSTDWFDISYNENGITVTLTPNASAILGTNAEELNSAINTVVEAVQQIVISKIENVLVGPESEEMDVTTIFNNALTAYINGYVSANHKDYVNSSDVEKYVLYLRDVMNGVTTIDGFVDNICSAIEIAVNRDPEDNITVDSLPEFDDSIRTKIKSLFTDMLEGESVEKYIKEVALGYADTYLVWLTNSSANLDVPAAVSDIINEQVASYINDEVNKYIASFTEESTDGDEASEVEKSVVADAMDTYAKEALEKLLTKYADKTISETEKSIIDDMLDKWIKDIVENYPEDAGTPIDDVVYDEIESRVNEALDIYIRLFFGEKIEGESLPEALYDEIVSAIESLFNDDEYSELVENGAKYVYDEYWRLKDSYLAATDEEEKAKHNFATVSFWKDFNETVRKTLADAYDKKISNSYEEALGKYRDSLIDEALKRGKSQEDAEAYADEYLEENKSNVEAEIKSEVDKVLVGNGIDPKLTGEEWFDSSTKDEIFAAIEEVGVADFENNMEETLIDKLKNNVENIPWADVWKGLNDDEQKLLEEEATVAIKESNVYQDKLEAIKDDMSKGWLGVGEDATANKITAIKHLLSLNDENSDNYDSDTYAEIIDGALDYAKANESDYLASEIRNYLKLNKLNENGYEDASAVVAALRDVLASFEVDLAALDGLIENKINSLVESAFDPEADDADGAKLLDAAFEAVFGKGNNKEAILGEGGFVDDCIKVFEEKYNATVEKLANADEEEKIGVKDLLTLIESVTVNDTLLYINHKIDAEALKNLIFELPTFEEIAEMSNAEMKLSFDMEVVTTVAPVDFNITVTIDDGYNAMRKYAGIVAEYLDFDMNEDGVIVFHLNLPEEFANLVLRAANSERVPDVVKKKVFAAFTMTVDDAYAFINETTLDDLLRVFDYVDVDGLLDSDFVSRFERLDGLTEEQIKARIKEYEGYYNKLISLISKVYKKLPSSVGEKSISYFYDGDGIFSHAGEYSVDAEALLGKINSQYAALVASFLSDSVIEAKLDLKLSLEAINKITYVVENSEISAGFLPAGADVAYFGPATTPDGYAILSWVDADGNEVTKMPDADTTIYGTFDRTGGAYVTITESVSKVYDGEESTIKATLNYVALPETSLVSYQWYKNGNAIPGAIVSTYTVKNVADSGEYYCVITLKDGEKLLGTLTSETCTVSITKADLDLTKYSWKPTSIVYDGTAKSVYLVDEEGNILEFGVTYVVNSEYTNTEINAGTYTAKVELDEANFNIIGTVEPFTWTIAKATYDMSGISFESKTVIYNGEAHSIEISGTLPEGVNVSYSGNGKIEPGTYTVTATFTGNVNYNAIPNMTATLRILGFETNFKIYDTDGNVVVEIIAKNGVLETYELSFKDVTAQYYYLEDESIFGKGKVGYVGGAYNIQFVEDGVVQPVTDNFTVKVLLPVNLRTSTEAMKVVYVDANGNLEEMTAAREGDYMVFTTTHFSIYAITEIGDAPVYPEDVNLTWLWILIAVLAVVAIIVFIIIYRRRKNKKSEEPDAANVVAAPVAESVAEEAPVEEATAEEALAEEPVVEEATAEEAPAEEPVVEEAPAEEAPTEEPVVEEAPTEEAPVEEPVVEEAPAEEAPAEEAPAEEPVVEEAPTEEAPVEESVVEEAPAEEAPVEEPVVEEAPAEEAPVEPVVEEAPVEESAVEKTPAPIPLGDTVNVRYRTSFMSRLIQAEEPIQDYYTAVKNALLSYKGVKARTSWNFESFNKGRVQCAKLNVKGNAFQVYLGLDPKEYNANKYHFTDVSDKPKLDQVPMLLKVKSERGLKYALELIEEMMTNLGMEKVNKPEVDYHMPYETTEELAARDLVKVILPAGVTLDSNSNIVKVDVGALIDSANADKAEKGEVVEETVETAPAEEVAVEEPAEPEASSVEEAPIEESVATEAPIVEEPAAEEPVEEIHVDAVQADEIISDEEAAAKIEIVEKTPSEKSSGNKLAEINLDTICKNFEDGDVVDLTALKAKRLISKNAGRVKILARGVMTKKLTVYADKFSLQAVKMITLAGGHADQYK